MTAALAAAAVQLEVDTTCPCGHTAGHFLTVRAPSADQPVEAWWQDVVGPLVGDGHACGTTGRARIDAHVLASPDGRLNCRSHTWEGTP